jgi:hypothetical protein
MGDLQRIAVTEEKQHSSANSSANAATSNKHISHAAQAHTCSASHAPAGICGAAPPSGCDALWLRAAHSSQWHWQDAADNYAAVCRHACEVFS